MDTKINMKILSIFLKLDNVLIILTVISVLSVLSTWRNLPLKLTIYRHDKKNAMKIWLGCTTSDVIRVAYQHHE